MKTLKVFKGHSRDEVKLMANDDGSLFVSKKGKQVHRNVGRMKALERILPQPRLFSCSYSHINMEYIPHVDMLSYMANDRLAPLAKFLSDSIAALARYPNNSFVGERDYTPSYEKKLSKARYLPASSGSIMDALPKLLPVTMYHGDFTLSNLLFHTRRNTFVWIDGLESEFDSYVFDLAKLRQDLSCRWFLRSSKLLLGDRLHWLSQQMEAFPHYENNALVIMMLLRIVPYADTDTELWLNTQMDKLWSEHRGISK